MDKLSVSLLCYLVRILRILRILYNTSKSPYNVSCQTENLLKKLTFLFKKSYRGKLNIWFCVDISQSFYLFSNKNVCDRFVSCSREYFWRFVYHMVHNLVTIPLRRCAMITIIGILSILNIYISWKYSVYSKYVYISWLDNVCWLINAGLPAKNATVNFFCKVSRIQSYLTRSCVLIINPNS